MGELTFGWGGEKFGRGSLLGGRDFSRGEMNNFLAGGGVTPRQRCRGYGGY